MLILASYKIPYPGLNESLKHLRLQVIESLPYVAKHTPRMTDPKQIFDYAKKNFRYKNDPPGVEFFQTVPTLLTDNEHFKAGEGDCDDATIYILSLLLINGLPAGIVLAGRNKYRPTHIYAYTEQGDDRYNLDLTNKNFNQIRFYPYKQNIPFKLSKDELNMYLQLADGASPRKKRFNRIAVSKPKLRILTDSEKGQSVFIPSKNVFIPAERFDKMQPKKVSEMLLSEGYEPEQVNEFLSGKAERKARKAQRQETKKAKSDIKLEKRRAKVEKVKAKTEVKKAKASKKQSAGEAKKMRAEAKIIKSQAKMRKAESGEEPAYKDLIRTAGNVVSRFIPSNEEPEEVEAEEVEQEEIEGQEPQEVEAVEAEEVEQEEMSEGFLGLNTNDFIKLGLGIGLGFAERKGMFK